MAADQLPITSVIIPAYGMATLSACVERLLDQRGAEPFEVIVCASADAESELPTLPSHPRLRVLRIVPRLRAAEARNRAVEVSRGRLLAFTDADVFVSRDWLAELTQASQGTDCIAGSVVNGTPSSAAGTVEYLVEFLDLHPQRPPRTLWHGATCNLLVPRTLWDELGPFPEDLGGGEDTWFTVAARTHGRFRFAPTAIVSHQNRTGWLAVARHQASFGRFTARLGRRGGYKWRPLVRYTPLAPLAVLGRIISLYARVALWDRTSLARAVRLFPGVVAVLGCWGAGLLAEGARLDFSALRARCRRKR
ncbi:MAG TPA: glycosyltransferase [Mycobacteriales bacterium]|nr:glycosyltransferase [Mycobacteriales bacterium]